MCNCLFKSRYVCLVLKWRQSRLACMCDTAEDPALLPGAVPDGHASV